MVIVELFLAAVGLATWGLIGTPPTDGSLLPPELICPGLMFGVLGMFSLAVLFTRVQYLKDPKNFDGEDYIPVFFITIALGGLWPVALYLLPFILSLATVVTVMWQLGNLFHYLVSPKQEAKVEKKALPKEAERLELVSTEELLENLTRKGG